MPRLGRFLAAVSLAVALSSCSEDPCDDREGKVLCGYCDQDASATNNPHAGMCRYCDAGTTCAGDVCSDALSCVSDGGGGGGGGCGSGTTCINNLCSPGLWCCPAGHSCNMNACGCN